MTVLRLIVVVALCVLPGGACARRPVQHDASRAVTQWQLRPSLKYDALCLLNALSGDPYYLRFYQSEYDHFQPLFTPDEQAAFARVTRVIKDHGGGIVSATLSLYFSAVDDETLPEMIRTATDGAAMKRALQATPYWSPQAWKNYEEAAPAVATALRALDRLGFAEYWTQHAKPRVDARIAELTTDLPRYDIIPAVEQYIGKALPSHTITVYVLAYSEPHDIRVTGLRFLTHASYPFDIVLHSAIHESMHPPYSSQDPPVRRALDVLSHEPIILDKVAHHDRSVGYNTAAGLIEEDSVEALEQIVSEQFGAGRVARWYWYQQDGGVHVLAPVIYVAYKQALKEHPEPYSRWFVQAVERGQLSGAQLKSQVRRFFFFLGGV